MLHLTTGRNCRQACAKSIWVSPGLVSVCRTLHKGCVCVSSDLPEILAGSKLASGAQDCLSGQNMSHTIFSNSKTNAEQSPCYSVFAAHMPGDSPKVDLTPSQSTCLFTRSHLGLQEWYVREQLPVCYLRVKHKVSTHQLLQQIINV